MIEAASSCISLPAGEEQREIAWSALFDEAFAKRGEDCLGNAVPAIPGRGDHIARLDHGDGVVQFDELADGHR